MFLSSVCSNSPAVQITTGRFQRKPIHRQWAIVAALLILILPAVSMAAQLTLAWDPNFPNPDGYVVYQRAEGQPFNYTTPAWPTDGRDHTETTCTLTGLTEGRTYYFVVRASVGNDISGDSNEVSYKVLAANVVSHTITATSGANGKIMPSGNTSVSNGDSQTYDFSPNTGYKISNVIVDGQALGSLSKYTFTNVTENHSISVQFVSVHTQNRSPVAEAGTNQTVTEGTQVILNATGSHDPDNDALTYLWTQTGGIDVGLQSNKAQCSFTAPNVADKGVTLAFELTVSDGLGLFDSDTCAILVNPSNPPVNNEDGIVQQSSNADGIVSIEAENFTDNVPVGSHSWDRVTPSGTTGSGAMQAMPNIKTNNNTGYTTRSTRLDYSVNFVKTGTHYIWIRGKGATTFDDSLHVGLDGAALTSSDRIFNFTENWSWSRNTMDGVVATIRVAKAGKHTINVWMREDGMVFDKIVLTTSTGYTPSGSGPNESPLSGGNQAPMANDDVQTTAATTPVKINVSANDKDPDGTVQINTVTIVTNPANGKSVANADGTVTYTPNAGFSGSDTFSYTIKDNLGAVSNAAKVAVTVSKGNSAPIAKDDAKTTKAGTPVIIDVFANDQDSDGTLRSDTVTIVSSPTNGKSVANTDGTVTYTPNAGFSGSDTFRYTIQDDQGAVSNVATVAVTVSNKGSIATGGFQQGSGADGIISIEAENYTDNISVGSHSWDLVTPSGHTGYGAMQAMPNTRTNNNTGYTTKSARLDYAVNFVKTGIHYVWIRGIGATFQDDSLHVGLDGAAQTSGDRISHFPESWGWSQNTMDGVVATIRVAKAGEHTINVWMREDGMLIDKIVLTTSSGYVPTDSGPSESPLGENTAPNTDGVISIEAENFTDNVSMGAHSWDLVTPSGHSGNGAMQAMPNIKTNNDAWYKTKSARLDYTVNFVKSGAHYIWVRGKGATSYDDSLHMGLDGATPASCDRISNFANTWSWSRDTMDGVVATINVATPGKHTLNVWMREDGMVFDKIVISSSSAYVPTGLGANDNQQ